MCRSTLLSHKPCANIPEDPVLRNSYFACYDCLRREVFRELEEKRQAEEAKHKAEETARLAAEKAEAERKKAEDVARIRSEADARARAEREEDRRREEERKREEERARKEGGAWVDAGGRKKKGRGGATPTRILASSVSKGKTDVGGGGAASVDPGGRAGKWGPAKKEGGMGGKPIGPKENERPTGWKK